MCSYARCSFFERRAWAQILPKMTEKSRHQPVFFYARAEAENLGRRTPQENLDGKSIARATSTPVSHLRLLPGFFRRARKPQRAPVKILPRRRGKSSHKSAYASFYQAFQRRVRAEKTSVEKGLIQKKARLALAS